MKKMLSFISAAVLSSCIFANSLVPVSATPKDKGEQKAEKGCVQYTNDEPTGFLANVLQWAANHPTGHVHTVVESLYFLGFI
ncbi:MAG: hypothetical protein LBJ95_00310 [Oscillospiraceae bacterium]|jgi:hypothetical protein|nr:hypothetical protein [Oscillospiraceae bacterium]